MNSFDNPLSFNERRKILHKCFPGIDVFPVPDKKEDEEWVRNIEERINFDRVVSGNEWTKSCFESEGYQVEKPKFLDRDRYQGTIIRKMASRKEESWKELVPLCSRKLLEEFNFQERMFSIRKKEDKK